MLGGLGPPALGSSYGREFLRLPFDGPALVLNREDDGGSHLTVPADPLEKSLEMLHRSGPYLEHRAEIATQLVDLDDLGIVISPARLEQAAPHSAAHLHEGGQGCSCARRVDAGQVAREDAAVLEATDAICDRRRHSHGDGLGTVGTVLAAHILGMFALSPLTGRLTDHIGGRATIACGLATLAIVTALTVGAASAGGIVILTAGLLLLGLGWNLSFVGGSSLLSRDVPEDRRTRLQGAVDALVWGSSGVATLSSGAILSVGGYHALALGGGAMIVFPLVLLIREHSRA